MSNHLSRRVVLGGFAATASVLAAYPALALSTAEARSLIDAAVRDITKLINSRKSEKAMYADIERHIRHYADVPTIARSALGPPARSASASQLKRFGDAFTGYLAQKYGRQFRDFIGGKVTVKDAKQVKQFQQVQAVAELRGQPPFRVSFMLSDRSGSPKFFDLVVEGVSLLKTERAEIGAMLDASGGSIDRLIQRLEAIA